MGNVCIIQNLGGKRVGLYMCCTAQDYTSRGCVLYKYCTVTFAHLVTMYMCLTVRLVCLVTVHDCALLPRPVHLVTMYMCPLAQACTSGGCATSAASNVTTHEGMPEQVLPPAVTSPSPTALLISWSQPGKPNGKQ